MPSNCVNDIEREFWINGAQTTVLLTTMRMSCIGSERPLRCQEHPEKLAEILVPRYLTAY